MISGFEGLRWLGRQPSLRNADHGSICELMGTFISRGPRTREVWTMSYKTSMPVAWSMRARDLSGEILMVIDGMVDNRDVKPFSSRGNQRSS